MKFLFYIITFQLLNRNVFSQDSLSVTFLKNNPQKSNSKRATPVKQTIGDLVNFYYTKRETNEIVRIKSYKINKDSAFIFSYENNILLDCTLVIWPNPLKKKGLTYKYRVKDNNLIAIRENEKFIDSHSFLIEKGRKTYEIALAHLLEN